MTSPKNWTTTTAFARKLLKLDFQLSPEERAVLVERARKSIEESTAIMANRLWAMPMLTGRIQ